MISNPFRISCCENCVSLEDFDDTHLQVTHYKTNENIRDETKIHTNLITNWLAKDVANNNKLPTQKNIVNPRRATVQTYTTKFMCRLYCY